jgi:hypothetical protein
VGFILRDRIRQKIPQVSSKMVSEPGNMWYSSEPTKLRMAASTGAHAQEGRDPHPQQVSWRRQTCDTMYVETDKRWRRHGVRRR